MPDRTKIITVAGLPGSGTSTAVKRVAAKLGYDHVSSGDFFRKIAADRGVSVEELNRIAEQSAEVDTAVDDMIRALSEREGIVIDSRIAFRWLPHSYKVYLRVDPQIAAQRIYDHIKTEGRTGQTASSVADVLAKSADRSASEARRYRTLYGIDVADMTPFDDVLCTSYMDADTIADIIASGHDLWLRYER